MKNYELIARADEIWNNRDYWTYVQGGLGELSTSQRIKGLYDYYRKKGNSSTCDYATWLKEYGMTGDKAKQCTDCSNFIQVLLGSGKNAAVSTYNNMPACPDIYTAPVGALLLIPSQHVGIVTKQGVRNPDGTWKVEPEQMDFYAYNKPPRRGSYLGSKYTKAVLLTGVDYTSSEAVPVSIDATVIKEHMLGDTLTAADFRVIVHMSDGSDMVNPPYWSAWPLKLTADVTQIKVTYKAVATTIPVKYKAEF